MIDKLLNKFGYYKKEDKILEPCIKYEINKSKIETLKVRYIRKLYENEIDKYGSEDERVKYHMISELSKSLKNIIKIEKNYNRNKIEYIATLRVAV